METRILDPETGQNVEVKVGDRVRCQAVFGNYMYCTVVGIASRELHVESPKHELVWVPSEYCLALNLPRCVKCGKQLPEQPGDERGDICRECFDKLIPPGRF